MLRLCQILYTIIGGFQLIPRYTVTLGDAEDLALFTALDRGLLIATIQILRTVEGMQKETLSIPRTGYRRKILHKVVYRNEDQ